MSDKIKAIKPVKKKRWLLMLLKVPLILCAAYLLVLFPNIVTTFDEIYEPATRIAAVARTEKVDLDEKEPIAILFLGIDQSEDDRGRSDTMILLTINPAEKSTMITSIPRDTYTELSGLGKSDKINHAYAFGGIDLAMATTEELLDIPVDYCVLLNMEGFQTIVDALGGVTVENAFAFDDFKAGNITLNGYQALDYVRMRKQDPDGDFGRQDRQKQVINSILKKGASANMLINYPKILNALGENVKTTISFNDMINLQKNYSDAIGTPEQLTFEKGQGKVLDDIWYYMMDPGELEHIQNTLKQHLDLH